MTKTDDMYERAYFEILEVLDEALGTEETDSAGAGIVADVRLLAQRYADLKALAIAGGGQQRVEEIETRPLRCEHEVPVDEDCQQCTAVVMATITAEVQS